MRPGADHREHEDLPARAVPNSVFIITKRPLPFRYLPLTHVSNLLNNQAFRRSSRSKLPEMEGPSLSPNFSSETRRAFSLSHKSHWSQIIQTRVETGFAEVCRSDVQTDFENQFPSGIQRAPSPAWRWGVKERLAWAGSPSSTSPSFRKPPYWRISLTFSKGQVK